MCWPHFVLYSVQYKERSLYLVFDTSSCNVCSATPSRGCGPFRAYKVMYESILATICEWPTQFQQFLSYVSSFAASILITIGLR